MKKKIIIGGCSFTYNPGSWAFCIPELINVPNGSGMSPQHYDIMNVARGGSGPITSVREVLHTLRETDGDKICIFQVSNPCRRELIINWQNNDIFQMQTATIPAYDQNICGTGYVQLKGFGGQGYQAKHTHHYNVNSFHKQAREYMAVAVSDEQKAVESYEMITLLQLYCKVNSIPLLIFYGWLDKRQIKGKLIEKTLDGIDWNNWFEQGNETMSSWLHTNGYKDNKGKPMDAQNKIRPTPEGHQAWYEKVIKPWIISH